MASSARMRTFLVFFITTIFAAGCHHDPAPAKPGDLPPLPPASGTPVGYLIDAQSDLKLRDDQLAKLKDIDTSLAAEDDEIDTQLRQIEKPDNEGEETPKNPGGPPPKRHNHAPGAMIKTTADANKLHDKRKANDRDALGKAFAVLDPPQQDTARRILADRGIESPGAPAKKPAAPDPDGVPLEP